MLREEGKISFASGKLTPEIRLELFFELSLDDGFLVVEYVIGGAHFVLLISEFEMGPLEIYFFRIRNYSVLRLVMVLLRCLVRHL